MKQIILNLLFFTLLNVMTAQIGPNDADALTGLPTATDLAEINAILNPQIGAVVYNLDDEEIYRYTGPTNGWLIATDDQNAAEVNTIASSIDLNGDGSVDAADIIDVDGDAVVDATIQAVIEAITPITAKAGRVFYPPSISIDASTIRNDDTLDLYDLYRQEFAAPIARNPSAPASIPIYEATELNYYVTFADPAIFNIDGITDAGVMTYDILGTPTNDNTIINVVFVVK